ncbi:MAG: hypothetical protein H8K03_21675 [Nitrospira sp.]
MDVAPTLLLIKFGLLSFWGLWFVIVVLTNLCEAMKIFEVFPWTWRFASRNFQPVALAIGEYATPAWIAKALFSGILLWQLATVLLFGWAIVVSLAHQSLRCGLVDAAFATGLGLWATFMLADEFCKQYEPERAHVLFFTAQLVTLLALHLLPV